MYILPHNSIHSARCQEIVSCNMSRIRFEVYSRDSRLAAIARRSVVHLLRIVFYPLAATIAATLPA